MTRLVDSPDIVGHATFCDDIRYEADGKLTLIGTYIGTMLARTAFPITLPKFGIFIEFIQRTSIFDPHLGLRIFMPGDADEKASIEIDMTELATLSAKQARDASSEQEQALPYISFHSPVMFAPLTINQAGTLKVRILRKDELHRVGAIRIVAAT